MFSFVPILTAFVYISSFILPSDYAVERNFGEIDTLSREKTMSTSFFLSFGKGPTLKENNL